MSRDPVTAASAAGRGAGVSSRVAEENRFTSIDREAADGGKGEPAPFGQSLTARLGLAAALALVVAVAWSMSRPYSADALHEIVSGAVASGRQEELAKVRDRIDEFLSRFPHDPRAGEMAQYRRELELARAARRLAAKAQRQGRGALATLDPAEHIYVEAMRYAESDPAEAVRRLEALIGLFREPDQPTTLATPSPDDDARARCVELANRQLELLRQRIDARRQRDLTVLSERLERAAGLAETDPTAAARIWRGIVTLYGNKPWAAPAVMQASAALEQAGLPPEVSQPSESDTALQRDDGR